MEKYIRGCVDSIISQTYGNLEIILVDDGSPDGCPDICDAYARADSRIRVIHKENGGVSDARNTALDICSGEYITFIDGDDRAFPDYVELLYRLILDTGCDISVCRAENVIEGCPKPPLARRGSGRTYIFSALESLERMLYQRDFDTCACGKMYKRGLFESVRYPKDVLYEDMATTYKLLSMCGRVAYADRAGYYYLHRPDGITGMPFEERKMRLLDICDEMIMFVEERYPDISGAARCRALSAGFHIYLQIPPFKPEYAGERARARAYIYRYRAGVPGDPRARLKTRLAALCSYAHPDLLRLPARLLKGVLVR